MPGLQKSKGRDTRPEEGENVIALYRRQRMKITCPNCGLDCEPGALTAMTIRMQMSGVGHARCSGCDAVMTIHIECGSLKSVTLEEVN